MTASGAPKTGAVLSADIAVRDHERVVEFYRRILGTGTTPLWRDDLLNNRGVPIIGIGEYDEAYAHLPRQWMPHIQVSDVAVSVERTLEGGGEELMHHRDEHGASQWAVLLDPNGAAFGVVLAISSDAVPDAEDAPSPDGPGGAGRIAWLDLTVADASATRDFYRRVVGWSDRELVMEDAEGRYADFVLCSDDGNAVAGICHSRGTNRGLPAAWVIYLPVADFEESLGRVVTEGGEVVSAYHRCGTDSAGAVVRDPVGTCIGLVPA